MIITNYRLGLLAKRRLIILQEVIDEKVASIGDNN
jgi:hypothetical protein